MEEEMWRFIVFERFEIRTYLSPLYYGRSAVTAYINRLYNYNAIQDASFVRAIDLSNPSNYFDVSFRDWMNHSGDYNRVKQ